MSTTLPLALGALAASLAAAAVWLTYWFTRTPLGPPRARPCLLFFLAGALAAPLALGAFSLLELSPFYARLAAVDEVPHFEQLAYSLVAIGPVEELAKLAVVLLALRLLPRSQDLRGPGPLFALAAAIGFATVESALFSFTVGTVDWARTLLLPFTHALFTGLWGVTLSRHDPRVPGGTGLLLAALTAGMLVHGLYDFILMSPRVASAWILPLLLAAWAYQRVALSRLAGSPAGVPSRA